MEKDRRAERSEMLGKILNAREKEVISLRFGFATGSEMTLREVGDLMGVTRERIRQIEGKALKKLRHHPRLRFMKDYL